VTQDILEFRATLVPLVAVVEVLLDHQVQQVALLEHKALLDHKVK
jgi:hypothetical protein